MDLSAKARTSHEKADLSAKARFKHVGEGGYHEIHVATIERLTLPAQYYTDPAWFEAEMERIFAGMWICAGRHEDIAFHQVSTRILDAFGRDL